MSEEPQPKPQRNAKGQLLRGHKPINVLCNPPGLGKRSKKIDDLASLRVAMLKALGTKEDLAVFLGALKVEDAGLYAKLLVQLEPKDVKREVNQQVVMVVFPEQPPKDWMPSRVRGNPSTLSMDVTKDVDGETA